MRIGLFGGSFDPPHKGHIAVAEAALRTAKLDRVLMVPSSGKSGAYTCKASARDRLNMCSLAVRSEPRITVSDIEAHRDGFVPTVDTVRKLLRQYRHDEISLIVGADKVHDFDRWVDAEELLKTCELLIFPRGGIDVTADVDRLRQRGARVRVMDVPETPGASHDIQQALISYEEPSALPREVAGYIAENWLYHDPVVLEVSHLMTEKRYRHTLGVREQAVKLSLIHGLNTQKAALAAMLHDSAKCMAFDQMLLLAKRAGVSEPALLTSPAMLHGPVGAYVAQTQFHVTDTDVLNAISWHTVGRPDMSRLEMCVFVADATEPGREQYPGLKRLRRLSERSLEAAVALSLNLTRSYVFKSGKAFNPLSDATMRWVLPRVPEDLLPLVRLGD